MVFNLAGYGVDRGERDAETAEVMNHRLVEALAHVASAMPHDSWGGVRLIHVGSALEYGTTGGLLDEDSPCAPTTLYGRSKLAGTQALQRVARERSLEACTARLFTVYGPGEHAGRLLPTLLAAADASDVVPLSAGTQRRDFAYVEDVVEGLLRLAVSDVRPGDIVNLATGALHPVRAFVETAADVLGIPRARLGFGVVASRAEEMEHEGVSVSRLRALTRWSPDDDVASGVARTMARATEALRISRAARAAARHVGRLTPVRERRRFDVHESGHRRFRRPQQESVDRLHALHRGMVLVRHFVLPRRRSDRGSGCRAPRASAARHRARRPARATAWGSHTGADDASASRSASARR